jgi:hypothetical protein
MSGFVAAAVTAVVATGVSLYQQNEAREDQQKANRKAARIEAVTGARMRAKALAENRVTQAQIFAQAANNGTQGSSGVQGAQASLGTQAAGNFAFANQVDMLNASRLKAQSGADNALANAGLAGQVASIGFNIAGG